jgi:predicted transcriptional regulator
MEKRQIPVNLTQSMVDKIDEIAKARSRSRNFILKEYILEKVNEDYPRIDEIRKKRGV